MSNNVTRYGAEETGMTKSRKERREALGWTLEQAAEAARVFAPELGDSLDRFSLLYVEDGPAAEVARMYPNTLAAYDAAITAEEKRRAEALREEARVVLADLRANADIGMLKGNGRWHGGFVRKHVDYAIVQAWDTTWSSDPSKRATYDAIIDALAVMAGETPDRDVKPEKVATWWGTAEVFIYPIGGPETPADADPMPTPPKGMTVERNGAGCGWIVSSAVRRATVLVNDDGSMNVCGERSSIVTLDQVRYAADLADWAAHQHTRTQQAKQEAERQRLRDAVREAEDAFTSANDALVAANEAVDQAARARDPLRKAHLDAAHALGFAREAARKGGAL